jgi:hypothetical protein
MIVAKKHLESKGAQAITAYLYIIPQSELIPDYFLEKVNELPKFPWENK